MRTDRSRTSGENFFVVFMAPSSQELEPPQIPGRFTGIADSTLSLEKIISRIILGPTATSPLSQHAVRKMLQSAGKQELAKRLASSTIPFRG
jgi:hypothetical protein